MEISKNPYLKADSDIFERGYWWGFWTCFILVISGTSIGVYINSWFKWVELF